MSVNTFLKIDLSEKRSECERPMRTESNSNESEIDLNECEHFLKANLGSEKDLSLKWI